MAKFFSFFAFVVAAVSAVPVVFNDGLVKGLDKRFSVVSHGAHFPAGGKLRFLFLVPKLGAEFDHFATVGKGLTPTTLPFLKFDTGDVFDHLLGLSDCATWHAGVLGVWTPTGLVHHGFTGVKEAAGFVGAVALLDGVVDFVFSKLTSPVFEKFFVDSKLPSHFFTFKLLKRFGLSF